MSTGAEMIFRRARPADLDAVRTLLEEASLPTVGVEENFSGFHVAEIPGGGVVGAIGLEVYGDTGLLRSAVVASSVRGMGIGSRLYDRLISHARDRGIHRLLLLTNTAADYFGKRGFRPIDQKTVTGAVTSSVEFSGACPSHATCMELHL